MRLSLVLVCAVLLIGFALPASAQCDTTISASGPDSDHILHVTGHAAGACPGSSLEIIIPGMGIGSSWGCGEGSNSETYQRECDHTWDIDTSCWPTGVYTAYVVGHCTILNESGSCGVSREQTSSGMSFAIDSTPQISLSFSPNGHGEGPASVGYTFPNQHASQYRYLETTVDGTLSLSELAVPMSGTWNFAYSTVCWAPGSYTLAAVGHGCSPDQTGTATKNLSVHPKTAVTASWADDELTVGYTFGNTGSGTGGREILVSIDGGTWQSKSVDGGLLPEGTAIFPMPFACGTGTHRIRVKAVGCGSSNPEYNAETATFASTKECPEQQTWCGKTPTSLASKAGVVNVSSLTVDAGATCPCEGKPVNIATGDVSVSVPLFTLASEPLSFSFGLAYHSTPPRNPVPLPLGPGWTHTFNTSIRKVTPYRLQLYTADGDRAFFDQVGEENRWVAGNPKALRDEIVMGGSGYILKFVGGGSQSFESYTDRDARWVATTDRWGNSITGAYDTDGRLVTITDMVGRVVALQYGADGDPHHVTGVVLPDGGVWRLEYYGGQVVRIFDPLHPAFAWRAFDYDFSHNPAPLTAVYDAASRIEHHQYTIDANGYWHGATSSVAEAASNPGSKETYFFEYDTPVIGTTRVRQVLASGLEEVRLYELTEASPGQRVPSHVEGVCSACGASTESQDFAYDGYGRVVSRTDGEGHVTAYEYDAWGNVSSVTQPGRRVTYEYLDPTWPTFLSRVTQPSVAGATAGRITTNTWNPTTHVLTSTVTGNLAAGQGASYMTTQTFDEQHRLLSVDGPRVDVSDVSQRVFYPDNDATTSRRGRIQQLIDAAGHTRSFDNYDIYGTARSVTDANGVQTVLVTNAIGQTTSITNKAVTADPSESADYVSARTYDDRNRLAETTSARGLKTRYVYRDATNWLTDTVRIDASGNEVERRHVTFNDGGLRTAEEDQACATPAATCSSWVTKRSESFVYDAKGRLVETVHPVPSGSKIAYEYDIDGKLKSVKDENHTSPNTTYDYDLYERLQTVTQKLGAGTAVTHYVYDLQDNLVGVTDPNGNITTYEYDDFGRMRRQVSPVTGTTTYTYDPAGNLLTSHDANAATTTRTYDVLGRVLTSTATHSGAATETSAWTYDTGSYGIGRLASMTDPTGSSAYSYERRGLLKSEAKTIDGATYTTSFGYDAVGNRTSMTYPSGRVITYGYDFADRPSSAAAGATSIVTSAAYLPFGPLTSIAYGNGTTKTMSYDARYRPQENKLTGPAGVLADYLYANDAVGNITQIHDALNAAYDRDFGYDDLNRLVAANSGSALWGSGSYTYDAMGNTLGFALGTSRSGTFSYLGTTPQIANATENGASRAVAYDAAGNESTVGGAPFTYSSRNFLETGDGLTYRYDGRGLRVITSYPASSLASLSVSPTTLYLNQVATGTVTIGAPASEGGVVVTLSSSSPSVLVPASITIPENATSAIFGITSTTNVASAVTITASSGFTRTASITLAAGPTLAAVSIDATQVVAGATAHGTVTLSAAAPPNGAAVTLSSDVAAATVPSSVTVAEGETTATFDIATHAVNATTTATITGQYGTAHTATLAVAPSVDLVSVVLTPASVVGGNPSTGTVTISNAAPAGGITVSLTSANGTLAAIPASVTVPTGATTASFAITTASVATSTDVVLSATFTGVTRSATLTLTPCVVTTATQPTIPTGDEVWIDDALPTGATGSTSWDPSQAASGTQSLVLGPVSGYLTNNVVSQTTPMTPVYGDRIVFYLLVDPCQPPRAIKVHLWGTNVGWKSAWWGEPLLEDGSTGINKGAVPTGGTWQRIEISAADLGLVDASIKEAKFQIYDGRAWFDSIGKHGIDCTVPTATAPTIPAGDEVWIDDAEPSGGSGNVTWDVSQAAHGTKSIVLGRLDGFATRGVGSSTTPMTPAWGDKIVFYLLVDPCTPPRGIKIHLWGTNVGWRAVRWGEALLEDGASGINMGDVPAGGTWHRIEIPAADLGFVDVPITDMKFQIYDGRAWLDSIGKHGFDCSVPAATAPTIPSTDAPWIDDALPAGMTGNIAWDTTQAANGSQSMVVGRVTGFRTLGAGGPTTAPTPASGESIVFYLLIDPCTPPQAVKVHLWGTNVGWKEMWWGEPLLEDGSAGINMGSVPTGGSWTRIEVPAADLGLEGVPITQFKLQIYDGRAWFDSFAFAPTPPLPPSMLSSFTEPSTVNVVRYSLYTPEMNLLAETAETTSSTPPIAHEYVWFAGQPIAQFDTGTSTPLYTFTDHLGTPLLQTDATATISWRAEYEPYGNVYAYRAGSSLHQPLRFPGQEADGERSYNIFRWYRGGWGRYTQGDPIGLGGGLNLFGYANARPTRVADPLGLVCDVYWKTDDIPGFWGLFATHHLLEWPTGAFSFSPKGGATVVTWLNGLFNNIPGEVSVPGQLGPRGYLGLPKTGGSGEPRYETYWSKPPASQACPNCKAVWQCLDNALKRWTTNPPDYCVLGTNCQNSVSSMLSECGLSDVPPSPPPPTSLNCAVVNGQTVCAGTGI